MWLARNKVCWKRPDDIFYGHPRRPLNVHCAQCAQCLLRISFVWSPSYGLPCEWRELLQLIFKIFTCNSQFQLNHQAAEKSSRLHLNSGKMVLAERNSENVRNGRRSRGPSPNGQTESSSEEDGGENFVVLLLSNI